MKLPTCWINNDGAYACPDHPGKELLPHPDMPTHAAIRKCPECDYSCVSASDSYEHNDFVPSDDFDI